MTTGVARSTRKVVAIVVVALGLAAAIPAAASANPQLGYNVIQAGNETGNWTFAHDTGNATWARIGVENVGFVDSALQANLIPILIVRRPTCADRDAAVCTVNETWAHYQQYCHDLAVNNPEVFWFEVGNEPNHKNTASGWAPAMTWQDYSQAIYYCDQGLSYRNHGVLGASIVDGSGENSGAEPAVGDPLTYLQAVDFATRYSVPRLAISEHIYPGKAGLDSPSDAADAVESKIASYKSATPNHPGRMITEMGIKDNSLADALGIPENQACDYKGAYLSQMFQRAGDNPYDDMGVVVMFRFSRSGTDYPWNTTGVYDPTAPYLNDHQYCGLYQLASVAG